MMKNLKDCAPSSDTTPPYPNLRFAYDSEHGLVFKADDVIAAIEASAAIYARRGASNAAMILSSTSDPTPEQALEVGSTLGQIEGAKGIADMFGKLAAECQFHGEGATVAEVAKPEPQADGKPHVGFVPNEKPEPGGYL